MAMAKKRKLSIDGQQDEEREELDEFPHGISESDEPSPSTEEIDHPEAPLLEADDEELMHESPADKSAEESIPKDLDTHLPESICDDEIEPESAQKLLEQLSKDQLINLLSAAADTHPDVLDQINRIMDEDPVHRKIFVHGLGWETTVDILTSFYSQYGEVEDSNVVCDKVSGKSKGYGFILFKNRSGARKALKNPQKKIGNRMTACQMASAGPAPGPAPPQSEYTQRKIYVSNVSSDLDPQKVLQFFAKYGEIEEGPLGLDKQTGKPKGFALFVYKTAEGARRALEEPHKSFEGHVFHCQKAIDGPKPIKPGILPHYRGLAMGGIGHLMAPVKQVASLGTSSSAGFSQGFGQNMAPLLAKPGPGLGLPMGQPAVNSGVRGIQGPYVPVQGNMNPGVMGSYAAHVPVQGAFVNPAVPHGVGRGKLVLGHRGGVGHYRP
ncbi:UBP1-associated protein 2A-like [Wolffia australiana]